MKYLWLLWLPLLYLPSLALTGATDFGTLSLSDFFVAPYIVLLFLRIQADKNDRFEIPDKLYIQYLIPIFILFVWWAFVSTVTLSGRYNYSDDYFMNFGLLKIAKMVLYVVATTLTGFALSKASKQEFQGFLWAVLVSGLFVGVGLVLTGNGNANGGLTNSAAQAEALFKDNGINVTLSMIIVFLVGMIIKGNGTKSWRRAASLGLIIIILGFFSSRGRGGWVAALVALVYMGMNINIDQTIKAAAIGILVFSFAYTNNETFRVEVDKTLQPADTSNYYADVYGKVNLGFDDGGRLGIFVYQVQRIVYDPVFGRGIFHRGGRSGIYPTGAHNFFLQMFLETGVPGGLLVIAIVRIMWVHASSLESRARKLNIPVQAVIIAGIVAGFTESYYYGGMELFTMLILYSTVGALQIQRKSYYN